MALDALRISLSFKHSPHHRPNAAAHPYTHAVLLYPREKLEQLKEDEKKLCRLRFGDLAGVVSQGLVVLACDAIARNREFVRLLCMCRGGRTCRESVRRGRIFFFLLFS